MNPTLPLLIVVGLGVLAYFTFRPEKGLLRKWQRVLKDSERILIEDALKHLYDYEYNNLPVTLQSISGALSISGDRVVRLLSRLESLKLVEHQKEGFVLTPQGRSYALRVIRIHRIWEKYLADETGIPPQEWHLEAEKMEHRLTLQEANRLAERMGNPTFDPHGDPIPTSSGEIAPVRGIPLTELGSGEFAEIVHIEDEPEVVYAQLLAQGLYPGMKIQMLENSHHRITCAAFGNEMILAPLVAANVTVQPLKAKDFLERNYETLTQLPVGKTAKVVGISRFCSGLQRERLMDLGIIKGAVIKAEMSSASGDPVAYRIRGAVIALRKEQTNMIYIEKS